MADAEVTGIVNAISLKFEWEIDNFSTRSLDVGECLESPKFTSAKNDKSNIEWCLKLFPNGARESVKNCLSIYLQLHSCAQIETAATIMIFDKEGKAIQTKFMNEHVYTKGRRWGFSNFISREYVTSLIYGILNDDKLRIGCEIKCKKTNPEENVLPQLQDEYEALFTSSNLSDVTLISEGKEVKAHKCILAKSSSVFDAMFNNEMTEKLTNVVDITDIKYDVLTEMIRFIYAGKANDIDALAGDLAIAADKYALNGLKNICEKRMMKILNIDNVINFVQLADTLRMVKLKKKAIEYIVENARDVDGKPEFRSLHQNIVFEIFHCIANKQT